jgi:hypothetical protein
MHGNAQRAGTWFELENRLVASHRALRLMIDQLDRRVASLETEVAEARTATRLTDEALSERVAGLSKAVCGRLAALEGKDEPRPAITPAPGLHEGTGLRTVLGYVEQMVLNEGWHLSVALDAVYRKVMGVSRPKG